MTKEEKTSQIISIIFHPLIVPTYGMIFMFMVVPYLKVMFMVSKALFLFYILSFFVMTCLFPALTLLYMYKKKLISNLYVGERKERFYPLIITLAYYVVYLVFFALKVSDTITTFMLLIPIIGMLLAFILTFFIKVSFHSIAMGAVLGFLFVLPNIRQYLYIVIALLVAGSVCSARLILNRYTIKQVVLGFIVGFISSIIGLLI